MPERDDTASGRSLSPHTPPGAGEEARPRPFQASRIARKGRHGRRRRHRVRARRARGRCGITTPTRVRPAPCHRICTSSHSNRTRTGRAGSRHRWRSRPTSRTSPAAMGCCPKVRTRSTASYVQRWLVRYGIPAAQPLRRRERQRSEPMAVAVEHIPPQSRAQSAPACWSRPSRQRPSAPPHGVRPQWRSLTAAQPASNAFGDFSAPRTPSAGPGGPASSRRG
jgi:hypothetical protein